jgi:hypothetical protein
MAKNSFTLMIDRDYEVSVRLMDGSIVQMPMNWLNGFFAPGTFTVRRRKVRLLPKLAEISPREIKGRLRGYQP